MKGLTTSQYEILDALGEVKIGAYLPWSAGVYVHHIIPAAWSEEAVYALKAEFSNFTCLVPASLMAAQLELNRRTYA